MSEGFPALGASGTGRLVRLDPRTKLIAAFSLFALVLFSRGPAVPAAVAALGLCGLRGCGMRWRRLRPKLTALLGMAAIVVLAQALVTGSWTEAVRLGSRALGCVSVLLLLGFLTPAPELFQSLRWLAVPESFVEIVSLMHRYAFVLIERARDIVTAQKVRLGYLGVKRSLASMAVMEGAVLIGSVDQACATFEAMRVRGYGGRMPAGRAPAMTVLDRWAAVLVPLACGLVYWALGRGFS